MDELEALMNAVFDGVVECECGNVIEPDGVCSCGRNSPLIDAGMI